MKKILVSLFFLIALVWFYQTPAWAETLTPYTVNASTYPTDSNIGAPLIAAQISGNAAIENVFISVSSTGTAQTVSIYELCQSTITATLRFRAYIPAGWTHQSINLPVSANKYNIPMYLTDACFRKSATGSNVQFNIWYR